MCTGDCVPHPCLSVSSDSGMADIRGYPRHSLARDRAREVRGTTHTPAQRTAARREATRKRQAEYDEQLGGEFTVRAVAKRAAASIAVAARARESAATPHAAASKKRKRGNDSTRRRQRGTA